MYHVGCSVGEGQDAAVSAALWQGNPVHADRLPASVWKLDGFEKSTVSASFGLGSLTNVTGLDEGFNGLGESRERVSAFHKISCFGCVPVSCEDTRMVVAKYFLYSGLGYDDSVDVPDTASGKMGVV